MSPLVQQESPSRLSLRHRGLGLEYSREHSIQSIRDVNWNLNSFRVSLDRCADRVLK